MTADPLPLSYQTPPPRVLGSLVIPINTVSRRMLDATAAGIEDSIGLLLESRRHDALHDAYLRNVERLLLVGQQRALAKDCGCAPVFGAGVIDAREAMLADEREDGWIDKALAILRRWAGAIEKCLKLRRKGGRS